MALTDFPWFKIYAAETLSDENFASWTPAQRGIWITLLCHCWKEGSIPSDPEILARLCGCDARAFLEHYSGIAHRFLEVCRTPGERPRLVCPRLEFERSASMEESNSRSDHARRGANARWAKYKTDMLGHCSGNAQPMLDHAIQPEPEPKIKEPLTPPVGGPAPVPLNPVRDLVPVDPLADPVRWLNEIKALWPKDQPGEAGRPMKAVPDSSPSEVQRRWTALLKAGKDPIVLAHSAHLFAKRCQEGTVYLPSLEVFLSPKAGKWEIHYAAAVPMAADWRNKETAKGA